MHRPIRERKTRSYLLSVGVCTFGATKEVGQRHRDAGERPHIIDQKFATVSLHRRITSQEESVHFTSERLPTRCYAGPTCPVQIHSILLPKRFGSDPPAGKRNWACGARMHLRVGRSSSLCWIIAGATFQRRALSLSNSPAQNNHHRLKNEGRHRRIEHLQQQNSRTDAESFELESLRNRGDPYDATLFTDEHIAFKEAHNQAFVALASRRQPGPVIYLDGADGATTRALLNSGHFHDLSQLHVANEWKENVDQLKSDFGLPHIHHGRLQDMDLKKNPFVAAYLDGCGGATQPVQDMVRNILKGSLAEPSMAIGFTLTNAEPTGRPLVDRIQDVTRLIATLMAQTDYTRMHHVGDDPERFGVDPELQRQHEGTTTCWVLLENE